jgi:hypothetical protein
MAEFGWDRIMGLGKSALSAAIMTAELLQSAVQSFMVSLVQMAEFGWGLWGWGITAVC